MNPKKEADKKARNSGISLEPELKDSATELARKYGFRTLSAFARKLLSDAVKQAADLAEKAGQEKKKEGRRKIEAARKKQ